MTVEEQRLSEWLQESTPEPPRAVTVEDVAAAVHRSPAVPRSRRVRSVVLPLVAAACAAGLAIGLAVGLSDDHHTTPATRTSTPNKPRPSEPSPTVTPAPIGKDLATIPWPAHLVALEPSSSMVLPNSMLSSAGRLYAVYGPGPNVRAPGAVWRLVRLDPANGGILARSPSVHSLVRPVATDGLIWTMDPNGTVLGLDPVSLAPRISRAVVTTAALRYSFRNDGSTLAPDVHRHSLLVGIGKEVIAVDTRTGVVQRRLIIDGQVDGLALTPDGSRLYVAIAEQAGGKVEVVEPATGVILNKPVEINPVLGLIATAGGVWVTTWIGMQTSVAEFWPISGHNQQSEPDVGTAGAEVLPTESGDILWMAGFATTCADPQTGQVRAAKQMSAAHPPGYVSDMTVIGHELYAVYTDLGHGGESALITLQPPAACGLR